MWVLMLAAAVSQLAALMQHVPGKVTFMGHDGTQTIAQLH